MFVVTENTFTNNDVVKYEDEYGNRLRITGAKDGKTLSAKIRFAPQISDAKVDVVRLTYPMQAEGIGYNVKTPVEDINEKPAPLLPEAYDALLEMTGIINKWIEISSLLNALTSHDMNKIASIMSKINDGDVDFTLMEITEFLLTCLNDYEEMQPFVKLYVAMAASNNKKGGLL